jgi:hypothetical protein
MKKFMLMFAMFLFSAVVSAQYLSVSNGSEYVIDLGTFAGVVALVSAIVTQISKLIPSVSSSKLAKIGISCLVGMAVCCIAWMLQISPLLTGYEWWEALIYGVASGLSGCGFYDLVKAVADLFKKKE